MTHDLGQPPEANLFDAAALKARLRDYGYTSMMQGSSMIRGGALAVAAVVLVDLMSLGPGDWVRLLIWVNTMIGVSAIYLAYVRAAILEPEDGRFGQVSLTLIGIVQMLQFTVLGSGRSLREAYAAWFLVTAVGGGVIIWEAYNRTQRLERGLFADELAELVADSRRSGWRRIRVMLITVAVLGTEGAVAGFGLLTGRALDISACAVAVAFGLVALGVHVQVHYERLAMNRFVAAALSRGASRA